MDRYYEKKPNLNNQQNELFFPINLSYKIGGDTLETKIDLNGCFRR